MAEASTADESDDREQESYRLLELIEVEEGAQTGEARLIETDDMVFGYELLPRATLREINFGRQRDLSTSTPIAGEHIEQRGFQVCTACGRVQDSPPPGVTAKSEHLPWCKVRTAGAPEDFVAVGLYRHNTSEAIRVLLPVADHEVGEVLNSVRAALELGFRRKFGGQPAHLRITTMSEPAGASRQRFLVIYDTVPGGTGYLAELWRQGELFTVMALALDAMKRCRCVGFDGLDGCYRCVYAHQHQRELASISRKRAVELFEAILGKRDQLKTIPSLSAVNLDSLLESELERRFITALRKTATERRWRWTETAFGGRQGFRIVIADDLAWEVRPQVDLGPAEGISRRCRPDFVLVPVGRATRRIAVFTDGFEFHAQPTLKRARIEDDIAKRLAILNVSDSLAPSERHWVWSLTWTDVAAALGDGGVGVDAMLGNVEPKTFGLLGEKLIAKIPGGARAPSRELGGAESFNLLIRWLADPDQPAMMRTVVALGVASLDLKRRLRSATAEAVRDSLAAGVKRPTQDSLVAEPTGTVFAALHERPAVALLLHAPGGEFARNNYGALRAQLRLYDLQDDRQREGFERSWRTFLQAWNLLQFQEVDVTSSERLLATGEGEPEIPLRTPTPTPIAAEAPRLRAELAALLSDFPECEKLLRLLGARDLPAPHEPYEDFILDGTARDVDLVWYTSRVALCYGLNINDRRHFEKGGWIAFDPGADDPTAIADALAQRSTQ
jgi:DEAD/DEAH box helicase domain-containing protein